MVSIESVLIVMLLATITVGLPIVIVIYRRQVRRAAENSKLFSESATELGMVASGLTNNDDYATFYDIFALSGDKPIWQTASEPKIYINPNRKRGAELLVKGNYDLPSIKLEAKYNKTSIQHRWGNVVPMMHIQLEGNFNDYFNLSCEEGQEVIALQIIAPNIMQEMIEKQMYYDVQIKGAAIMLTTDAYEWTPAFMQGLLDHATTLDGLVRATQKVTQTRAT